MNKNFKIIQLNALSGLLVLLLLVSGLVSGFVLFPIWGITTLWNKYVTMFDLPFISYAQGTLLWVSIGLGLFLSLKNSVNVKIQKNEDLSDYELKEIIKNVADESEVNDEK